MPPSDGDRFVVVGGGIAGLVVARRLALAGRTVTLIDAGERLGGAVAPLTVAGVELDAGAESFATRSDAVPTLLHELGLHGDVVAPAAGSAWVHRADGRSVPLPAAGVLGIPADPGAADVRRAVGRVGAWRARIDRVLPARVGADAASVDALVRTRMGAGVADTLVAPVVRGVYSRDSRTMPVAVAAPRLPGLLRARGSLAAAVAALRADAPAGSLVGGLRGGMLRLSAALADDIARLGVDVRTGTAVTGIEPARAIAGDRELTGRVVLAASAPDAPPARPVTLVTLVVDAPALDAAPRGTGVLVAPGAGVAARALTHVTAKWTWVAEALPGRHVLRLSYDAAPKDAATTARSDAEAMLGVALPAPREVAVRTWSRAAHDARDLGMPRVGEAVAGTGLAAVVAHAESTASSLLAD
ncbi:protoporphyrinogen oxidase [Microbacterium awajiense]|uniref:Protoporphyrinogen oxidase n=1 Tax=Microbacterium awajiense TaxID=415214 RepID=A0ABP7AD11_9MICO